jgi:hypothetical protein
MCFCLFLAGCSVRGAGLVPRSYLFARAGWSFFFFFNSVGLLLDLYHFPLFLVS